MKKILVLTALSVVGASANAVTLAVWNFNDSTGGVANLVVDRQVAGFGATMTSNFAAANITHFGGTTINADSGDVAGQALALQGGDANVNNGRHYTIQFNSTGWQDLTFSMAVQRTSTGFTQQAVSYSTDGVNFTSAGLIDTMPAAFGVKSLDLSSISAIENTPNVWLRFTLTGASSASGNNRMDNMLISGVTAVPEPATMAVLGLGAAALLRRRNRKS